MHRPCIEYWKNGIGKFEHWAKGTEQAIALVGRSVAVIVFGVVKAIASAKK